MRIRKPDPMWREYRGGRNNISEFFLSAAFASIELTNWNSDRGVQSVVFFERRGTVGITYCLEGTLHRILRAEVYTAEPGKHQTDPLNEGHLAQMRALWQRARKYQFPRRKGRSHSAHVIRARIGAEHFLDMAAKKLQESRMQQALKRTA